MNLIFLCRLATVFTILETILTFDHKVVPNCDQNESICEFNWTIGYLETMVYYSNEDNPQPIVVRDGILQKRLGCDNFVPINNTELNSVVTADGYYKVLYAINGQVPGPSIVVYEGQQVVVHLRNNLLAEGITIHWHGMIQRGTPWMDGVGTISHCPINPGEVFTYRWIADPIGTHWYHAHLGVERTDGLAGALVVLPKETAKTEKTLNESQLFAEEYIMVLQDWKYSPSIEVNQEIDWGLSGFPRDLNDSGCYSITAETDGGGVGLTAFESGVINGKGHYFLNNTMEQETPALPYETFLIEPYKYYRFRVMHVGMIFAFRLSFDNHDVQVISIDGNDIEEEGAESVIIHGGERVDIVIYSDASVNNYWIRAETLEYNNVRGELVTPGKALGILRYKGAPTELPNTERKACQTLNRCKVINCPFESFPDGFYTDCMAISDLISTKDMLERQPVPTFQIPSEFQEIFINFHFSSGAGIPFTPSVNGKNFVSPSTPPQIYPASDFTVDCSELDCTDHCRCTHFIQLIKDKVVQIVLLNIDDAPFTMPHPIHMHGHHFHVLKTGFPEYNSTTGQIVKVNSDILCNTPSCNSPTWKNESWNGGNIPGLNLEDPPIKDTIIVPGKGYIVLRIKADNPGYWFMHCHIEIHQIQGMAVVLKEGEHGDMAPTPSGFPKCGNFEFSEEEFQNIRNGKKHQKVVQSEPVGLVIKEMVEETYVMVDKPRNHVDHHRTYKSKDERSHHHDSHGYITISKTAFIILVISCVMMAVALFLCFCLHCVKRIRGNSMLNKKHHFTRNIQQQHMTSFDKSESKRNLVTDSA